MENGHLATVDGVIDALGGTNKVAELSNQAVNTVSNWRARKRIPPEHFLIITSALKAIGKTADPERIFGMRELLCREDA